MSRYFLSFNGKQPLPDDVEDQLPAVQKLMATIREALPREALGQVSELQQWDEYGSYFEISIGRAVVTAMLQASDEWLLMSWLDRSLIDRLLGRQLTTEEAIARDAILAAVRKVTSEPELNWLTEQQLRSSAT